MATTLVYQHSLVDDIARQLYQRSMSKDKRSPDQPAPFKGEFSFVNKDAGNIDSKDHNAAVSWHVMNRYERWKKQEQAKKLRASANVPVGPLSPPSQQPQQPKPSFAPQQPPAQQPVPSLPQTQSVRPVSSEHPNKRARLTRAAQSRAIPPTTPFEFDPWTAEQPLQLGYPGISSGQASSSGLPTSTTSTPSTRSSMVEDDPTSILASLNRPLDPGTSPFEATSLSMTPLVNNLIAFAYEVFIPQSWPRESDKDEGSYEIARSWDDAALINQDVCHANAYLSLLAAAMAVLTEDESLAYQSRYFQDQAMTELRQRVARPGTQDLVTLKAILKLFSSETLVDNTSVARMHLKMLRNLVNAAGGVILMDAWFREDLLSCDCYFALKYETRPLFPASEWTPGPLSQPWKARLLSAGVFGDHAATIDPLVEHALMKAVITDLRELFKAHDYTQIHDVPSDDQLLRWKQLRKFDCISRLADHYVNVAIYPHLFQRPLTQAYTCVATALMTAMFLGSPEPVRFGLKLLTDLRTKLTESVSEDDAAQFRRLRLWALYVGSLAEQVHPVSTADERWFREQYQSQSSDMGLLGWEDTKKVMRQFLYSEKLHQEIESGRAHRVADARQGLYTASGTSWREPWSDTNLGVLDVEEDAGGSVSAGKRRADDD
ncbi:uncharacterized protein Z520_08995 [Fonsecaea multimorphosa CBS 102226]|uniref:Transcription factor domain-containing protein n=1 Tax=Fonsecaea multimorphosa CBS 102226 TaxID=1442371 RepID=A0A0D2KFM0_9EURO|nr:uncharacterized protein Z520_08995 [Fonsecaea multimorphosa CBS 102226]KIX95478.1 hypothetical protein Z520_08995 [Fonsecaea multimorphosa CBS 102226]OAL21009.1 hypothetical protein AYO22_08429 [Fonsecaea multimorphosa]